VRIYLFSIYSIQSTYKYPYLNAPLHSQPGYLKSIEVRVMMAVNPTYSPVSGRERKVQVADYSALQTQMDPKKNLANGSPVLSLVFEKTVVW
jgi:hypothetical protein